MFIGVYPFLRLIVLMNMGAYKHCIHSHYASLTNTGPESQILALKQMFTGTWRQILQPKRIVS